MSPRTTAVPDGIVAELERLGFKWTEDPQYELARIKGRVQVRDEKNVAPKAEVKRYSEAMHYSKFPPIIVTEDDYLDEGNTRVESYKENGVPAAWAIILKARYDDPDPVVQARLHALAVGINNLNGRAHSDDENRDAARFAARAGWQIEEIARTLKVSTKTASEIVREVKAQSKLESLGITLNGGLTRKQLQTLGSDKVLVINNAPYEKLAELARNANLGVTEIRELSKEIVAAGSDEAALALLAEREASMSDRIAEVSLTGTSHPKPPTELRRFLGNIIKYEDNPTALVEHNPEYKERHQEAVARSISILTKVYERQMEIR